MTHDDRLISAYVKIDPHISNEAEVRLAGSLIHVWAIVAQLKVNDFDVSQTARDYGISEIEVQAAHAYFRRHREAVDARIADHVIVPARRS